MSVQLDLQLARQLSMPRLLQLLQEGFAPRLIVAHGGSGLPLFVKTVCPQARLVNYIEWYFSDATNRFLQPRYELDDQCRLVMRNAVILQELEACDAAVTPTRWQWQQFPGAFQSRIRVIFDGVDTRQFRPQAVTGPLQLEGDELEEPLVIGHQEVLRRVAREQKVASLDLVPVFRANNYNSLFADSVHATRRGYALVANTLAPLLQQLMEQTQ